MADIVDTRRRARDRRGVRARRSIAGARRRSRRRCTADAVFIDSLGNRIEGKQALLAGWRAYFRLFPDYRIEIDAMLTDGREAMLHGRAGGTLHRDGQPVEGGRWEMPAAWRAASDSRARDLVAGLSPTTSRSTRCSSEQTVVGQSPATHPGLSQGIPLAYRGDVMTNGNASMLALLIAQAEGQGADMVTLRALIEEASEVGRRAGARRARPQGRACAARHGRICASCSGPGATPRNRPGTRW